MGVEFVEFVAFGSLLKVEALDFVDPSPHVLGLLIHALLPEGIQEPDDLCE